MSDKENVDWNDLEDEAPPPEEDLAQSQKITAQEPDGEMSGSELEAVYDVPVKVSAVLGITNLTVNRLLKLGSGSVLELDRKIGEAIDIYVNNRLVARGEVVLLEKKLGITMTEIITVNE